MKTIKPSIIEAGQLSGHLAKFPIYLIQHNQHKRDFERDKGYHPLFSRIVVDAIDMSQVYSLLIDYNKIYLRSCRPLFDTGFIYHNFSDLTNFKVERGRVKILLKLSKFSSISFAYSNQRSQYLIMHTNDRGHQQIKQVLEPIYRMHDERSSEIKTHSMIYWDYDNISLKVSGKFDDDPIAIQIKNILDQFNPIDKFICMTANETVTNEVEKIKQINNNAKFILEIPGDDRVDQMLVAEILEGTNQLPEKIVIISGDHYYIDTVQALQKMDIEVYLISLPNKMNNKWEEILSDNQIIRLDNGISTIQNGKCSICGKKIRNDQKASHQKFHDPNICHICNEEKKGLKQHIFAKHSIVICDICDIYFETSDDRHNHMNNHHDERYCEMCKKDCHSENGKQAHLRDSKKHK